MANSRYDISVIIPVYNVEEYIRPCLDSVLRQGPVSLQVIMIDDGSTDSSPAILDEYADGLHFLLSLGIPLGVSEYKHYFHVVEKDLSKAIVKVYEDVSALHEDYTVENYAKAFRDYLNIIPLFDYSSEEVIAAYKQKCGQNHIRQETHY